MNNEDLDREVLHALLPHQGKSNCYDRWELVENIYKVHVPVFERNDDNTLDKNIRDSVARLRAQGYLICDMGDGAGRWMAETEAEFWEFYNYYIKPIKTRRATADALKAAAKKKWPNLEQPSLFDVFEMEMS